ncbi:hypothetical protein [Pseudomonas putida]|uniref:hypothetical protein n=1 Tax=Pseudomonas putida TaxID=303 RepID=UPI001F528DF8|nr:hypothetical protein [Pseudomonas putida]
MPTENRSSTIEQHDHIEGIIDMVSVPREWLNSVALLQMPLDELQEQAIQHLCEPCNEPAPQPHPEPIAWMVGTAFWWTKEEAERDAAETGLPIVGLGPMSESNKPTIPQGYCLMPRRLTAENGAKALLLGEFKLEVTRECPECLELDEPADGCEICDGEGEYAQRHTIPWDMIKFIYSEAVKGLAFQPNVTCKPS